MHIFISKSEKIVQTRGFCPLLISLNVCSLRNDLLIFGVHCWTLAENLTNTDSLFCTVGGTYSHTLIS